MRLWFGTRKKSDEQSVPEAPDAQPVATPTVQAPAKGQPEPEAPPAPAAETASPEALEAGNRLRAASKGDVPKAPSPAGRADDRQLYKQLLRGLYDAVLITDAKGHVVDSNERAADFFAYPHVELWEIQIGRLIGGLNPQVLERVRSGVSEDRFVILDAQCIRKDQTTFPGEVAISSFNLIGPGGFIFAVRNVERRKKAQQRYRSEHNALMSSPVAVAICDIAGRIEFANPTMLRLWGFADENEAIGQDVRELFPNAAAGPMVDTPLAGEPWSGPLSATTRQGAPFVVEVTSAPDKDLREHVIGFVCSFVPSTNGQP